jgi:GDPmannose 4,6-dehydratase
VVAAACRIAAGSGEALALGDLEVRRDWGWAPEYVEAMWRMLQQEAPDDYVVATGRSHSLREFVAATFAVLDLDWQRHVATSSELLRPAEIHISRANPAKAAARLGWQAGYAMREVIAAMVAAEQELLRARGATAA